MTMKIIIWYLSLSMYGGGVGVGVGVGWHGKSTIC